MLCQQNTRNQQFKNKLPTIQEIKDKYFLAQEQMERETLKT